MNVFIQILHGRYTLGPLELGVNLVPCHEHSWEQWPQ